MNKIRNYTIKGNIRQLSSFFKINYYYIFHKIILFRTLVKEQF